MSQHPQTPGVFIEEGRPTEFASGLNSKTVSSLPACGWMDSLCSSSNWHWASGRRTLLLIYPFVFLSPLSGLKTNGERKGREGRRGVKEKPRDTSRAGGETRGKRDKWSVHAFCVAKNEGTSYKCRRAICVLCFLHEL